MRRRTERLRERRKRRESREYRRERRRERADFWQRMSREADFWKVARGGPIEIDPERRAELEAAGFVPCDEHGKPL